MIKIDSHVLGQRIKEERLNKNISIKDLANDIGVTSSLLSQIERGVANPSLNTLSQLSKNLDVPMFSFFISEYETYNIKDSTKINNGVELVKKNDRIRIISGKSDSDEIELGYDLLSPDLKGSIQLCEMILGAKTSSSKSYNSHDGEEVAVCIKGDIELILEDKIYHLKEGDSARISNGVHHRWYNPTEEKCILLFAINPPIF